MDIIQADDIVKVIHAESSMTVARVYLLGNEKEYVVLVDNFYFVWCKDDWYYYRSMSIQDSHQRMQYLKEKMGKRKVLDRYN